jgi:predicted ATP-grasp superfamily ATP-dependent carboligase
MSPIPFGLRDDHLRRQAIPRARPRQYVAVALRKRENSRPRRVLVSGDEFHASLALVRGLRAGGYLPVLAVALRGTYASRSRAIAAVVYVPHAHDTPAAFAEALARAAIDLEVDAILPGTEASLMALAQRRDSLPCELGAPAPEVVDLATDKGRVLALAATSGLDTPPSIVASPAELAARADEISYPAILKPLRTRLELGDSRLAYYKACRVADDDELRAALDGLPEADWVVQPYLDGGLSAVSGVAWEGRLACPVHQISRRIWPPHVGYSSYAETVAADPDLESRVASLLEEIGWSGLFQAQFLRAADGRRFLIDFNPRAYGSLALAVHAGANLPALWAALVLGTTPPPMRYRPGVRYRLEHNDLRAIARTGRDGDIRRALAALLPRPRTAHAIFSLRDPGPLLTTAEKLLAARGNE